MMTQNQATQFAREWIAAWNARDVERGAGALQRRFRDEQPVHRFH